MDRHAREFAGDTEGKLLSPRQYDESDVRVRPGRGSRPRTKTRPEHLSAESGMVVSKDRGRWGCVLGGDPDRLIVTMRARELGRTPIVVGDQVDIVGDLSGKTDTLARIVRVSERSTVLRRTADDTDPFERIVVANAEQLSHRRGTRRSPTAHRLRRARTGRRLRGWPDADRLPDQERPRTAGGIREHFRRPRHPSGRRRSRRSPGRTDADPRAQVDRPDRTFRRRKVDTGQSPCPRCQSSGRHSIRRRQGPAHVDAIGGTPSRRWRLGDRHPGHPFVRSGAHLARERSGGVSRISLRRSRIARADARTSDRRQIPNASSTCWRANQLDASSLCDNCWKRSSPTISTERPRATFRARTAKRPDTIEWCRAACCLRSAQSTISAGRGGCAAFRSCAYVRWRS